MNEETFTRQIREERACLKGRWYKEQQAAQRSRLEGWRPIRRQLAKRERGIEHR